MAISITKPTVGGSEDTWGTTINTALDTIVDGVNGTSGTVAPDLSTLTINGTDVTATAAELNIMDGVTATTAELNKLDGVTATTTELNYVDGVTSNIQTQLNNKQASNAILSDLSGLTQAANKIPYFNTASTASTLSFVDEDNMSSNSATAVPSQQSVKAYVDNNTSTDTFSSANQQFDSASGFQVRFGTFSSTSDQTQDVTFTTAFDNACVAVTTSYASTITNRTATGFTVNRLDAHSDNSLDYIAIGY